MGTNWWKEEPDRKDNIKTENAVNNYGNASMSQDNDWKGDIKGEFPWKSRKSFARRDEEGRVKDEEGHSIFDNPPQALVEYLSSLNQSMTPEDADVDMARKICEECSGWEPNVCFSSEASRIAEDLARKSDDFSRQFLRRILTEVKKKTIFMILKSRNGSHVLETLLIYSIPSRRTISELDECIFDVTDLFTELTSLISEEWASISSAQGYSHVVRTLGRLLSGCPEQSEQKTFTKFQKRGLEKSGKRNEKLSESSRKNIQFLASKSQFASNFEMLSSRALSWTLMKDYFSEETTSLIIQDFIAFDSHAKKGKISQLLDQVCDSDSNNTVLSQWKDKQGSRVWEKIISGAGEEEVERIYGCLLEGQLSDLSIHPFANFPLQRLLEVSKSEEMIANVMDELGQSVPDILGVRHFGVLSSLIGTLAAHGDEENQKKLLKALRKTLHCNKPKQKRKELISRVLCLSETDSAVTETDSGLEFEVENIQYHGSMLVQKLLGFKIPSVAKSLLAISANSLLGTACHVAGCHCIDSFFNSSLDPSLKKELADKLSTNLLRLALDKYGSRVLDTMWKISAMKEKSEMASLLAVHPRELARSQFGRIIFSNYRLETFKRSVKEWRNEIANLSKKRKIFD